MEFLLQIVTGAFGLAVGGGALIFVLYRSAFRWRKLAEVYAGKPEHCIAKLNFQTVILTGMGVAFNSYKGIVTFEIGETGIVMRLFAPFSLFHPPLFIPFSDLSAVQTEWFLNDISYAMSAQKVPGISIIVSSSLIRLIEEKAGLRLT